MATTTRYEFSILPARQFRTGWLRLLRRPFAVPGVPANAVPNNVVVTVDGTGLSYILNWSASPNATSYNIYRSTTSNGVFSLIGSSVTTTYTDTPNPPGTYWYKVTAVDSFLGPGESGQGGPGRTPGGGARRGLNQGTE